MVEENALAIDNLHLEAQTTKRATLSCLHTMRAAAKKCIVETFKAAKQSFEAATHAAHKADDCSDTVLKVHDEF